MDQTRRTVFGGIALSLVAGRVGAQALGLSGVYTAVGRNPDGSSYRGKATLIHVGDTVSVTWQIDGSSNRGKGKLNGRILTVDWGDSFPVFYIVMPDGELHGTWADGRAHEKLTPN